MDPRFITWQCEAKHSNFIRQQPKSFEELHIERSYLLNCLQREDHKATELLKNIRLVQDALEQGPEMRGNRNRKRVLRFLRNRMRECTEQEKSILARLGHVTYDIQSRERLIRVENEKLYHLDYYGVQRMQLNATQLDFTPRTMYNHQAITSDTYGVSSYAKYSMPVTMQDDNSDGYFPNIYQGSDGSRLACNPTFAIRPRSASTNNLTVSVEKEKRLSMPGIPLSNFE